MFAPARGANRRQARRHPRSLPASSPASALLRTGTPSSAAMSSAAIGVGEARRRTRHSIRESECCRGAVTSMTPLPCCRAAAHRRANASSGMVPMGKSRTSNPSPVGIGAERPGTGAAAQRSDWWRQPSCAASARKGRKAGIDIVAPRMPKPRRRAASSRSAIAAAACGFSRSRKARTSESAT